MVLFGIMASILYHYGVAVAAKFNVHKSQDATFIFMDGPIIDGDLMKLRMVVPEYGKSILVLNSPGGQLLAGIELGRFVRMRGIATAVLERQICMSACVIVWLGGVRRYLSVNALLGAHAAYQMDGEKRRPTGAGNALLGAYLKDLGLSYRAIAYLTAAGPNEYLPVTLDIARKLGIEVIPVKGKMERRLSISSSDLARRSFLEYFVLLSLVPDEAAISMLRKRVSEVLSFYKIKISFDEYIFRQVKYALKWPLRIFVPKENSISVECRDGICIASGLVEWLAANKKKKRLSIGSSIFHIAISETTGQIILVDGKLIKVNRFNGNNNIDKETHRMYKKKYNFRFSR